MEFNESEKFFFDSESIGLPPDSVKVGRIIVVAIHHIQFDILIVEIHSTFGVGSDTSHNRKKIF